MARSTLDFLCLNPCFNGRCTSTFYLHSIAAPIRVLILVLMEDALVQVRSYLDDEAADSLNPCFNGRCTSTVASGQEYHNPWSS